MHKGKQKIRVLFVQQINRAYRVPLLKKLSQHPDLEVTVVYGTSSPVQAGDIGISIATDAMPYRTISGPISGIRYRGREILWFGLAMQSIKSEFFDVVICDYYTRLLTIWPMQSIQHRRSAKFILWGIGFHQKPTPLLDKIRIQMVNRSDALILYSENENRRYQEMGVQKEKCFVARNTVDIEGIDAAILATELSDIQECRKKVGAEKGPLLMHVGRLAENKRLDLIVCALPELRKKWPQIQLALIGEGPKHPDLSNLARELLVEESVHFLGSITDHKRLAPWVLASDLFVAPAQIGLMAPMSLVYGRTLVISDVKEHHGPEVQVFLPGETGLNYKYGNINDLTRNINILLADHNKCKKFANAGAIRVREQMGSERMVDAFISAIRYVTRSKP